jgi:hypothetical protein
LIYLAIVVSEFNNEITFKMLEGARDHAATVSAKINYIIYVPGTYDMPLAVEGLLKKKNVDAVVTLGAVIKGDTRHDDIVAENAARLLASHARHSWTWHDNRAGKGTSKASACQSCHCSCKHGFAIKKATKDSRRGDCDNK